MSDSILDSTKKMLGVPADYDVFDVDIVMHINSALATLNQVGVGPADGFAIQDATPTWADLLGGDKRLNHVQTYVFLSVKMLFDPPSTSYLITAYEKQLEEKLVRISIERENNLYVEGALAAGE